MQAMKAHKPACSRIFQQRRVNGACVRPRLTLRLQAAADTVAEGQPSTSGASVDVRVENTSFSSRKLLARVQIRAPVDTVWGCLTDYERLGEFVPNLAENRCLERRPDGAVLYQVGAQEVAMGVKFSARATLECKEYHRGIPRELCTGGRDGLDGQLLPWPSNSHPKRAARDISFVCVDGDFKCFKGVWRMQQGDRGVDSTLLVYALYVKPQSWLPVGLIQSRISREVVTNLQAVREYSEQLHRSASESSSGESSSQ